MLAFYSQEAVIVLCPVEMINVVAVRPSSLDARESLHHRLAFRDERVFYLVLIIRATIVIILNFIILLVSVNEKFLIVHVSALSDQLPDRPLCRHGLTAKSAAEAS